MKHIIYVLGSPIVKTDRKAIQMIPFLASKFPTYMFQPFDPTEELPLDMDTIIFIDVIYGIKRVTLYDDIETFELSPHVTGHDFDLPVQIRLLKKIGKLKYIKIIGIPQKGSFKSYAADVERILASITI